MRFTFRTGLRVAKWTLAVIVAATVMTSGSNQAQAHFFRHLFGYHGYGYGGFGCGGLGYRGIGFYGFGCRPFRGCYSSYYAVSTPYYYSTPVYYTQPIYTYNYCVPYVAVPTYSECAPYFSDVTYSPSYPIASAPPSASWPVSNLVKNGITPTNSSIANRNSFAAQPSSTLLASSQNAKNAPLMMLRHPEPTLELATIDKTQSPEVNVVGKQYVARKPAVLQPYSPIWTQAATGLVDDLIAAGQLDDAAASCKSMEKIEQAKGAGVYLRQGLLGYFANTNSPAATDKALSLLEQACATGSQLEPSELSKSSLREYFANCSVDLDESMEKLSQSILENPNKSGRELLMLTVLLRMDGQSERSKLFAVEAEQMAAKSDAFHWNNLLNVCQ
jgi:hypothetical protein